MKKITYLILSFAVLTFTISCKNADEIKKRELAKKAANIKIVKVEKPTNLGEINKVSVDEFNKIIQDKNVTLVDVRTPKEYAEGHLKGAVNVDFKSRTFPDYINVIDKNKPVAVYCHTANRSGKAALIMQSLGFKKIYDLDGGIKAWKAANMPVTTDNNPANEKIQQLIKEKAFKAKNVVGKDHQVGVHEFETLVKSGKVRLVDVRNSSRICRRTY